jgi:hypothetical protein
MAANWGVCRVCFCERKLVSGDVVKRHRRFVRFSVPQANGMPGFMIACSGSLTEPVSAETRIMREFVDIV